MYPPLRTTAFIDDVVNGLIQAGNIGIIGEKYILGGENIQLKLLFKTIKKFNKDNGLILEVPLSAIQAFSWTASLTLNYFNMHTVISPDMVNLMKHNFEFNCTKASSELNYHITPFDQAMEKTIGTILNRRPS